FARKFISDCADQRISVLARQLEEHLDHAQIWNRAAEDLHVLDLASHNRLLDTFALKEPQHLAQLADTYPRHVVSDAFDFRIGFFTNRSDGDLRAGFACAFDDQKRELSVARDQTEFH